MGTDLKSEVEIPSGITTPWAMSTTDVISFLQTDLKYGLSTREAQRRLTLYGPNVIRNHRRRAWYRVLGAQFIDFMVGLLLVAALISVVIGETTDAILIGMILFANAIIGFSQEWTAERAIESLRKISDPVAKACRDGAWGQIPVDRLVVGELIELNAGDIVPSDARLISINSLETVEASLTGESTSTERTIEPVVADRLLPERSCMVFAGTSVVSGSGRAVVTQTGNRTELGRIAELLATTDRTQTPLQLRLNLLTRQLTIVILLAAAVLFVCGVQRHGISQMLLISVGLTVAAVPEGLPAVITIGLAIGAKRMAHRRAIIRRLTAVETLGSVNVICTDKTGTLTQNVMTVSQIVPMAEKEVFNCDNELLQVAVLCSNAQMDRAGRVVGSPTERAFMNAAIDAGMDIENLQHRFKRIAEIPFTSSDKRMMTLHRTSACGHVLLVKGALEHVLQRCDQPIDRNGRERIQEILQAATDLASQGQRVLAFARRVWNSEPVLPQPEVWDAPLEFLGLISLSDPIRTDAPDAIRRCRLAGIHTVMITGDHPETARAIAAELDIWHTGERVLTGADVDHLSDEELRQHVPTINVFARVTPEHKLRIVRSHQALGSVTAMTGDGVNDAPALQQADIGVSMGMNGTNVAQDASAMVLADDNFVTIVEAVEEGRAVYDNIRKCISYLLAGNTAEVLLLFSAVFANLPLPLLPIQILWVNLVTDGLPALSMAFDFPEKNVMRRLPRQRSEGLLGRGLGWRALFVGCIIAIALLVIFVVLLQKSKVDPSDRLIYARTAVFMTLALAELIYAMSARNLSESMDFMGFFKNKPLVISTSLGILLQVMVCYHPKLQPIFHTVSLSTSDFLMCLCVATVGFITLEVWKRFFVVGDIARSLGTV